MGTNPENFKWYKDKLLISDLPMINEGFYGNSASKYSLEKSFEKNADLLSESDKKLIIQYLNEKEAVDHIGERRYRKIGFTLVMWRRFLPCHWNELKRIDDVYKAISALKKGHAVKFRRNGSGMDRIETKPFKINTIYDAIVIVKPFLLWLSEKKIIPIKPEVIKSKVREPDRADPTERIKPESILTADEVLELIKKATTERDRALLHVTYESGARAGEIGRLTWADIVFERFGAKMYITDTKTNKRRYTRLIASREALLSLKNHRIGDDASFVFLNEDRSPMTYVSMTRALQRALQRSEIKKHVSLHSLRHARATHMVQQNYQESVIKKMLWGNLNSKQFQTYVSLGEQDIDNELLKQAGIETSESERPNPLGPRPCAQCGTINGPDQEYCGKCGLPLNQRAAGSQNGLMEFLYKEAATNPQVAEAIRIISEAALKNKA